MDQKEDGSITVFLSIIFLLFFAMFGVTFENVRSLISAGHVRTSAYSAAVTAFGDYNKELYREYGLFGYGGAEGKNVSDLEFAYQRVLFENLSAVPVKKDKQYVDLFGYRDIDAIVKKADYITDSNEFLGQVTAFLKQEAVMNIKDTIDQKIQTADKNEIQSKLAVTKDYEQGKYEQSDDKKATKGKNAAKEKQEISHDKTDSAGGNPLKFFTNLARDGILGLVCDEDRMTDGVITSCQENDRSDQKDEDDKKNKEGTKKATDIKDMQRKDAKSESEAGAILSDFISKNQKQGDEREKVNSPIEKISIIRYANKVFSSYTNEQNRTTKYGLEYLIGGKSREKDNDDPMKIAIVVDMWLTGFDVPSLATMYIYKPMHGYNLMQAIARVNRVFKDKEGGLIVDYVGIASALKAAMKEYTKRDQSRYGDMDISKVAYPKFQEKLQVCKDLLHGFDFSGFIGGSPLIMAKLVTGGVNFALDAKAPKRKDLFLREAMLLKQSHSLCSSMTTEQERHEAAYMEAVRSTVVKITYGGSGGKTLSLKEINAQINELLKASIQSQGVISLFDSKQADENISLFDPAVLDEISKMKEKNIAVEILKKLMAEQVSLYKRTNVVQSQKFSEKIAQLMNSYYNGLITNEEVIKELLKTAQEITELYNNGKKLGLTQEELAFYDALTKPENIKDFYQNNELIDLTRELTEMLRKNRTIDWQKKETARASMRKMVKHLLKKYKYPPEDYDTAISTVISQCEMWTDNMTA